MDKLSNYEKLSIVIALVKHSENLAQISRTHIQKELFFLQELLSVPLGYDFVLYHYGPYSFKLDEDIWEATSKDYLLDIPLAIGGAYYSVTETGKRYLDKMIQTVSRYENEISFVSGLFGKLNATKLELAATIVYVIKEMGLSKEEDVVKKLRIIKPHFRESSVKRYYSVLSEKILPKFEEIKKEFSKEN